jgi:hypothetical protein
MPAPILGNEFLQVLVGLRFEVAVLVKRRLQRMQQQGRQAQRLACDGCFEGQRFRS